ncbi:MAG: S10 family peptidase [Alphaproteobacteria bacterium]
MPTDPIRDDRQIAWQGGRRRNMRAGKTLLAALLCLLVLGVPAAPADDTPRGPATAASATELPARVETRHSIQTETGKLDYRAIAETIGLTTPKGEQSASIFTVSYIAEPEAAQPANGQLPAIVRNRPVAFVFNGGPGASAVFLHLGALGPRILETPPSGAVPSPPYVLADNPHTWLPFADLVFVDPVGTGYSRGTGTDDNPDKPFWEVRSDLRSLAAVVRRWLTRHNRWTSPVYLVGESYGGLRAAALGRVLVQDVGIAVSGFVLVSPALSIDLLHPDVSNVLAPALQLPSYAATAAAFGETSPTGRAREAERFALTDYITGLAALTGIPEPGNALIERTAALIGLPAETVRRARGRVDPRSFARELRRPEREVLSIYDGTVTRPGTGNPRSDRAGDPILDTSVASLTAAFKAYAGDELGYRTEQPYRVLARDVSQGWDWDAARGEGGLGIALSSLQDTLLLLPQAKVFVATGLYDLVTPYFAAQWLLDQLALPETARRRIHQRVYEGGHMMYMRPQVRAALAADAAPIFAAAAAPAR